MDKEEAGMIPYGLSLELYKCVMKSKGATFPVLGDFE